MTRDLIGAVAEDNSVSPGVLGFVVVALLGVATWLLVRSMRRQLKKIDIPEGGTPTRPGGSPEADAVDETDETDETDDTDDTDETDETDETEGPGRPQRS